MVEAAHFQRRMMLTAMLTAPALAALGSTAASAQESPSSKLRSGKVLTAYFTRSGNTRVLAGTIERALKTDLFEIKSARPYPEDYEATVALASRERDGGIKPKLAQTVPGLAGYEEIYLGFPVWGMTAPPIMRSFLAAHDWSGKTIHPFITHGGYGEGNCLEVLKSDTSAAKIGEAFILECDQEKRTIEKVSGWLKEVSSGPAIK